MRRLLIWLSFSFMLYSAASHAELSIEITQGVDQPVPVAVVPFTWQGQGSLPDDVAKVISSDLHRSGLFALMNTDKMLSFPTRGEDVFFRDWRLGGQEYLVIGRIKPDGDGYRVEYELFDVINERRLDSGYVSGRKSDLRRIAHRVSDLVYEELTGIRGAFATEVVYVSATPLGKGQYTYRLHLADSDGANEQVMLESREPIMSPSWSYDGNKLAYVSFETGRPAVYIHDKRSGQRQQVTGFKGLNGAPSWSPDGRKLAVTLSKDGNPEIYMIDIGTGQIQRLTHHYGIDTEPSWSPDGSAIIFTSDRGGKPQIYRMELANGWIERLTFEGDYNARGRLSHNGRHLVMVHRDQGVFHIAVQDLKTGRLDVLTETYLDESPSIAPNGTMVVYATQEGTKGVLAGVSIDGRVKFKLPSQSGDVREPAWSPYLYD